MGHHGILYFYMQLPIRAHRRHDKNSTPILNFSTPTLGASAQIIASIEGLLKTVNTKKIYTARNEKHPPTNPSIYAILWALAPKVGVENSKTV